MSEELQKSMQKWIDFHKSRADKAEEENARLRAKISHSPMIFDTKTGAITPVNYEEMKEALQECADVIFHHQCYWDNPNFIEMVEKLKRLGIEPKGE